MTIGELIEELQKLPADLRVFTRGYEFGFVDPIVSAVVKIDLDGYGDADHGGPHAAVGQGWVPPTATIEAVVIGKEEDLP